MEVLVGIQQPFVDYLWPVCQYGNGGIGLWVWEWIMSMGTCTKVYENGGIGLWEWEWRNRIMGMGMKLNATRKRSLG